MTTTHLFFDVSNTLLEKEELYPTITEIVQSFGYKGSLQDVQRIHRQTAEKTVFPVKTTDVFYRTFNAAFVQALGIHDRDVISQIIDTLHTTCRALPWVAYSDVDSLQDLPFPKGIISNWDASLQQKVDDLLPYDFFPVIGSFAVGVSKPNTHIFAIALKKAQKAAADCWYIGDSMTLDIEPAQQVGMKTILLDRYGVYPDYRGNRITSLCELSKALAV